MDSLVLGLCTDNVVTVLQPSSTIECGGSSSCSCSSNIQTGTVALGTSFYVPAPTLVTGYITATVATGAVTVTLNGTTINTPYVVVVPPALTTTIPFTFFATGNVTLAIAGTTGTVTYQYLY
jgi:hypothetical protein